MTTNRGTATGLAEALTELASAVRTGELEPLEILTEGAADLVGGTDLAAVVVASGPGRLTVRASSGPMTVEVIKLQSSLGQGPALDVIGGSEDADPVEIVDSATEPRWPLYVAQARTLGVGSMLCLPLPAGRRVLGALCLAGSRPDAFDEESRALAALFAAHSALALAGEEWRRNLATALSSRDVIGQAKGILMERFRVTPDAAFALLVKASQRTHTKLRTVSEELCRTGLLPPDRPAQAPGGGV